MDDTFLQDLQLNEVDVAGALERISGDETLYMTILRAFPEDPTMAALEAALKTAEWDEAFTAAHALKGLAGNLGMTPLFHTLGELVILIRAGRIREMEQSLENVKRCYNDIVRVICNHCK